MNEPNKFELEVQSTECVLAALDVVREAFNQRHIEEGLSKKEFSKWLGKDPSYVSRVLNGRVSNVNYKTITQMLLALRYFPELAKTDFDKLGPPANYCHSYAVEDQFTRFKGKRWSVEEEETNQSYRASSLKFEMLQG